MRLEIDENTQASGLKPLCIVLLVEAASGYLLSSLFEIVDAPMLACPVGRLEARFLVQTLQHDPPYIEIMPHLLRSPIFLTFLTTAPQFPLDSR